MKMMKRIVMAGIFILVLCMYPINASALELPDFSVFVEGLNYPVGVAVDNDDNLYVLNSSTSEVIKYNSNGIEILRWGSYGSGEGQLSDVTDIAVDSSGNVYVSESANNRIQKFTSNGDPLNWGSSGSNSISCTTPRDIEIDRNGTIYVTEYSNQRIVKFASDGSQLTWESNGTNYVSCAIPYGIAVDSMNNIYAIDNQYDYIRKYSADGTLLASYGAGRLINPRKIAIDSFDNIYVTDINHDTIQKFNSEGEFLAEWGGTGSGAGWMSSPQGIVLDSAGNVYVADTDNARIQKMEWNVAIDKVMADKTALTPGYGSGDSALSVTKNLTLPVLGSVAGSDITWSSSNTALISNNGVVTRPDFFSGDAIVTLTATIVNGTISDTREFVFTVTKLPQLPSIVTFHANGGDTQANPPTMIVLPGATIGSLPTEPTWSDHIFLGWNTTSEGSGSPFAQDTVVNANITVYAQWADRQSIAITTPATKLQYTVGDSLDISGMVVTSTYSNNSTLIETITEANVSGFDSRRPAASQTLTVTVGGKTATYTISISAVRQSIAITTPPTKLTYAVGEILDVSGIVVTGYYVDGSTKVETITAADVSGFDSSKPAISQILTVTVEGKTTSYTVTITGFTPFISEGLDSPYDVAVDKDGNVYVLDTGNFRVLKYDSNGNLLTEWGSEGYDDDQFEEPVGIAVDLNGHVYVADNYGETLLKFDSEGNFITLVGDFYTPYGTQSRELFDVAVDSDGNVYVSDEANNLEVFDSNGNSIKMFNEALIHDGGIAIDSHGNIYIADEWYITKYDSNLNPIFTFNDETPEGYLFYHANRVAIDKNDYVYVVYTGGIIKFDSDGNFLIKWVADGNGGNQFNKPLGVAVDLNGTVYVADTNNNQIQKLVMNHIVTFNKNGGDTEAGMITKAAVYGGNIGTLPVSPTKAGYTFTGWNTSENGTGTNFTATTVVTTDLKVYAQWTKKTSGGGGSSSSGGGGTTTGTIPDMPSVPPVTISETPFTGNAPSSVTATTTTEAKADSNGNAEASVTESQMTDAINKAVEATAQKGGDTQTKVEIKVTAPADAKSVETSIPKAAFTAVADGKTDELTVSTPIATITFDNEALSTISKEMVTDVKITASKVDYDSLSEETKQKVVDRPVFNFSVTSGDKTISQFGGNVEVEVPYTPKAGEDPNSIVVYYINAEGKLETISNCTYDPATGMISFRTNHFSMYAVGYNKISFKDVAANTWYNSAVSFIAARGITSGTGNGNYSPEQKLTRGEFLVMLMKAYGISPDSNVQDNFLDAGDTYYTNYLAAAKRLGISAGVGNDMFAPSREITRQEMFTLLYNLLNNIGQLPQGDLGKRISDFSDTGEIAPWAENAMTFLVETGIIGGYDGKLNPESTTTRADMAQVLYNLLSN